MKKSEDLFELTVFDFHFHSHDSQDTIHTTRLLFAVRRIAGSSRLEPSSLCKQTVCMFVHVWVTLILYTVPFYCSLSVDSRGTVRLYQGMPTVCRVCVCVGCVCPVVEW